MIIQGDSLTVLRGLPSESVQAVVTSPPYWGLRDYGVEGQLGLERTPEEYIEKMTEIFREVRRVLRKDGVCWINMGDGYAQSGGKQVDEQERKKDRERARINNYTGGMWGTGQARAGRASNTANSGLKPKDLCGIPWRLALALQADGWWLRQDIIWAKPNAMPESVKDRCCKAHEYIFMLTRAARYYYDADAVREPAEYGRKNWIDVKGTMRRIGGDINKMLDGDARWRGCDPSAGRNLRSVWSIPTHPFPDAHFATFPPRIPELCIKASTRPDDTVLDPFAGAGTTGLVAQRLGRRFIGIELNPEYVKMAEKRIHDDMPLFADICERATAEGREENDDAAI